MRLSGLIRKNTVTRISLFILLSFVVCCMWKGVALTDQSEWMASIPLIQVGDPFPKTELVSPKLKADREYLGLSDKPGFYLNEVKADVMLVEFMNVHCLHCLQQAPILDKVFAAVEKEPEMRQRVKFLSIGVGNQEKELEAFRKDNRVPFPMIPDEDFVAMENIGYPEGTPFLMILRKDEGKFIVKFAHMGMIDDPNIFLDKMRLALSGSTVIVSKQNYKSAYQKLNPGVTKEKILKMLILRLESRGYEIDNLLKLNFRKPQQVYMVKVSKGAKKETWFAAVGAEGRVCDICHDVYFIYLFDREGTIRELLPIQLTKFRNVEFDEEDMKKIRADLVGKNLLQPIQFNPDTDAVSSATMTSALVFKSIKRGKKIYEKLKKEGYIK